MDQVETVKLVRRSDRMQASKVLFFPTRGDEAFARVCTLPVNRNLATDYVEGGRVGMLETRIGHSVVVVRQTHSSNGERCIEIS